MADDSKWICGFKEIHVRDLGYPPDDPEMKRRVEANLKNLVGTCCHMMKPGTPFTKRWMDHVHGNMTAKLELLRKYPARHAREQWTREYPYPFRWLGMCGEFFHPMLLDCLDKIIIVDELFRRGFNYRGTEVSEFINEWFVDSRETKEDIKLINARNIHDIERHAFLTADHRLCREIKSRRKHGTSQVWLTSALTIADKETATRKLLAAVKETKPVSLGSSAILVPRACKYDASSELERMDLARRCHGIGTRYQQIASLQFSAPCPLFHAYGT